MPRPRVYDDQVRSRLLEEASATIARDGVGALSLRAVAAAAATTTAAVYTLFGSREALLDAVVAEGFRRFAGHLDAAPVTEDPQADLLALGLAYRRSALADPHFYRVMFATAPGPADVTTLARPTFQVLRRAAARVIDERTAADRVEEGAQEWALQLWALVHGLVSLELAGHMPGDADERAGRYADALVARPV